MYKTLNNVRTTEKNKARVNEIENRLTGLIEMLRSNPTSDEKKKKKKKKIEKKKKKKKKIRNRNNILEIVERILYFNQLNQAEQGLKY